MAVIIDGHCHAGEGDGLTAPADTSAPLGGYLRRCAAEGITHHVLFPPLTSDYAVANRSLATFVARHRGRMIGFAFVHPVTDAGRVADMVTEAVDRYGFRGIKVHWRDGRVTREIADVARRRRLPVIYDPGGDIGSVEIIARAYPDVAWIVPHLSSFADDWKAQVAFVDQLVRLPNVFTDTSGVRHFDVLRDAVRRAGARKVIFGTDGPFLHPGVELSKIRLLNLARDEQSHVLGGNILGLIRRVRRTPTKEALR